MSTCSPKRNKRSRCQWCTDDPLYINYHDTEWGIPLYNGLKLFAMLQLEGMQAGLNWLTILKKREAMTRVFCNFNPKKLSELPIKKREALILNPEIIRNKLKINAVFQNSEAYLEHFNAPKPFSQWLWDFVDNTPHINHWKEIKDIPTQTDTSIKMSKALKKLGFSFVGPTICYAFMQATGMVWDHTIACWKKPEEP